MPRVVPPAAHQDPLRRPLLRSIGVSVEPAVHPPSTAHTLGQDLFHRPPVDGLEPRRHDRYQIVVDPLGAKELADPFRLIPLDIEQQQRGLIRTHLQLELQAQSRLDHEQRAHEERTHPESRHHGGSLVSRPKEPRQTLSNGKRRPHRQGRPGAASESHGDESQQSDDDSRGYRDDEPLRGIAELEPAEQEQAHENRKAHGDALSRSPRRRRLHLGPQSP